MPGFSFNLETVLNYRRNLEESAKENLAASLSLYQREKGLLETIETELSHALKPTADNKLNLDYLLHQEHYQGFLYQRMEEQVVKVASAKGEVSTCRLELEKKMQDRKVLEKLKEKRREEFLYLEAQGEQKRNDDMAVNGFIRKQREIREEQAY